ncbi:BRO family protein [Clostridioides sp. ZZV14-6345]|uniref:BRO-N domain-containing protein n=1 Tax=Clostridioides sp. ZZV14-6345 TaxID=2811496 RepID=UPI001D10AEDB
MNNLMVFEGKEVEIFEFEGKILFNPKHVAKCLELSESATRNHLSKMNSKQVVLLKNSNVRDTDFRKLHNTGENFLTESGVYKLIFTSRKEEAERFQDWIADEVLPSIRKTGAYNINSDNIKDVLIPIMLNGMLAGFEQFSIENDKKIDDRFNQIKNRMDEKINDVKSLIGFRSKNVTMLSKLLKLKLSYIKGYNVNANDYDYRSTTTKIFSRYNVSKWEDIPVSKFNEVHALIDTLEEVDDIYTWKN